MKENKLHKLKYKKEGKIPNENGLTKSYKKFSDCIKKIQVLQKGLKHNFKNDAHSLYDKVTVTRRL